MIKLYTAATPNGRKVSIALEEIGVPYDAILVDLGSGELRGDEFLKRNPNHKIPILEDEGRIIWESGAILLYLGEKWDPEHRILPRAEDRRWEAIQYAFFQTGGVGPNLGRLAEQLQRPEAERNDEMVQIFSGEIDRLMGVLDRILSDGREYLAVDYSIADIMHYPWLQPALALGAPQMTSRPRVVDWMDRIAERPAVRTGLEVGG